MRKVELVILAPPNTYDQHVPAGFIFADEVFAEARLKDGISTAQAHSPELERALSYLAKRYPGRVQVRRVDLWSLPGLWLSFRYRVRSFPAILVNRKEMLCDERLRFEAFTAHVAGMLSQPEGT